MRIELTCRARDLAARDLESAQLLGQGGDFARRAPLHVHLGQGELERALASGAAVERRWVEAARADLRNRELDLADSRLQALGLGAIGVIGALGRALIG